MSKEHTYTERKTKMTFRVQRNGITDRVYVGMGEELDVEGADSIEIISIETEVNQEF